MSPAPGKKTPPTHREILEDLASKGVLEEWRIGPLSSTGSTQVGQAEQVALTGHLTLQDHRFRLRVTLPRTFPGCLPEITIEKVEPDLKLPHLVGDRQLCYEAGANLLDRHDPWGVAYEALLRARAMLSDMLSGSRAQEFAQEVIAYWSRFSLRGYDGIGCDIGAGEHPYVTMALYTVLGDLLAVADEPKVILKRLPQYEATLARTERALYIPIDPVAVDPNFEPKELGTLAGLRKYIRALPQEDHLKLEKLLARRVGSQQLVVLGVRRPRGERALIGVHLEQLRGGHPLAKEHADAQVVPVELLRYDHAFLAPRGGASVGFRKRRVLLAGCGAVGGHIALALARAGVGQLSLVDQDVFELANTYRHVCGMAQVGQPKVLGLKHELERLIPYVEVTPHAGALEQFLQNDPAGLRAYDLIISALGHPTIELDLNERLWSDPGFPPAIFAWVEPLGLGGHVLLTHVRGSQGLARGCLECIHQRPNVGGPLENRAAFASPDVTYTHDTLGCGSQHLPFADLDALRTAELAARLALRVLRGEVEEAPLLSWKGDRRAFEQAGYTVTHRYKTEPDQLEAERLLYRCENCPVCGE
ncbi:ThiF family adenylyltransferase [Archangium lansingense]|uniref:ThiF family adenylyltransferase n=1 Tax=Archangium lansingense TaxID=2995310 RepID=A0ABT4A845_9BACT|nr:ThiF family adenylyltransferase [Archangium lansinium]MCY1077817.1 ThiF family adenylyltransferase [Archangium lansinium]